MTSGRNIYDPVKREWAQNIMFHPGRNGETVLLPPVSCVKKAVLGGWAQGDNASDLAILELSQDVGTRLGWNGLLCGEDAFLKEVDPINLAVNLAAGKMFAMRSAGHDVYDNQIAYKLSADQGMGGANPWVVDLEFSKGPYSLGVHTGGVRVEGKGVVNLATRITQSRLECIVNVINNVF
jgi:V8-like Glu-specific endopeptidase